LTLLEQFVKIQKAWPSRNFTLAYDALSRIEMFEIAYHAASDVAFRCFSIKINPGDEHKGDVAILFNSATKQFISLLCGETMVKLDLFEETDAALDVHINEIKGNLEKFKTQLIGKNAESKDQITKCILVERKVDEAVHLALAKEVARKVFFAIGECRERAALVPVFQNSTGADLVQLALHKWMDATLRFPQDIPFPEDKIMPLVKNFLQIKKWLRDLITNQLAGINTVKAEIKVE